jgi:hypothetical protein
MLAPEDEIILDSEDELTYYPPITSQHPNPNPDPELFSAVRSGGELGLGAYHPVFI